MSITNSTLELGSGPIATVQVARQPVMAADARHTVLGYQLSFSDSGGLFDAFAEVDETRATTEMLGHTVLTLGVDSVVGSTLAFVTFPREQVLDHAPLILPPAQSVIQLSPDSWAHADISDLTVRCREYRSLGYRLGLTDYRPHPGADALLTSMDYVSIDVAGHDVEALEALVTRTQHSGPQVIVSGVDTAKQRERAVNAGATYLQGFSFSAPDIVVGRELPGFKLAYLQLLRAAFLDDVDFEDLAEIIKQDVALSYKLLKYINSAHFGLRGRVESVQRALTMLGLLHLRSWVGVATVSGLVDTRPQELAVLCATRARFCESLGRRLGLATPHECFSLGMFSLLDVLLGTTLEEALVQVPLSDQVRAALHGEPGDLADLLVIVVAYERGQWNTVARLSASHGWSETELIGSYIEAIEWSRDFFGIAAGF